MAKLIYFATASLNGYITDERGKFGWAEPDQEVHQFVNDLVRDAGTHLYRLELELVTERRFRSGMVYLQYRSKLADVSGTSYV